MKTVALRFSDRFAPEKGTIKAHQDLINELGSVWYGKLGLPLSDKAVSYVMSNDAPRILLIHSGKAKRYWAFVDAIQKSCPQLDMIPCYYRDNVNLFHTWFHITSFLEADKTILSEFKVLSSGQLLSSVSKHSMSPYFIIGSRGD